jgi:hypothetical protein
VEGKHLGSKDSISSQIDKDTKVKIEAMNRSVAHNKEPVISTLITEVCNIVPAVHQNHREY